MLLFKSRYAAKSTKIRTSNAISSVRLDENDLLFLKEISTQQKARLFLKVAQKERSKRTQLLQWLYLRSGGHEIKVPQAGIADDLGVSVRSIKRYVKELLEEGYINVRWFRNSDGTNSTSIMRLTAKAWRELINLFTDYKKALKTKVFSYYESLKALFGGGDTMAPSIELKEGNTKNPGECSMIFPKKTKEPKVRQNIDIDIPF